MELGWDISLGGALLRNFSKKGNFIEDKDGDEGLDDMAGSLRAAGGCMGDGERVLAIGEMGEARAEGEE